MLVVGLVSSIVPAIPVPDALAETAVPIQLLAMVALLVVSIRAMADVFLVRRWIRERDSAV